MSSSRPTPRLLAVAILTLASAAASAKWLKQPTPGTPCLPDGKPNLSAPAPRTPEGVPDLSGIWEVIGDTAMPPDGRIRSKYLYNIAVDQPGGAPFQPWAKALHDQRQKPLCVGWQNERCLPPGITDR